MAKIKKFKIIFLTILLFSIFSFVKSSQADTHNVVNTSGQPSCEAVDVQRVINDTGTSDGDTVFVSAGSCTWSTTVNVTKAITLRGAGVDKTIITDNTTTSVRALKVDLASGNVRITGFTFNVVPSWSDKNGIIVITGGTQSFRVDNNKFDMINAIVNSSSKSLNIGTSLLPTYGVIDHNHFINLNFGAFALFVSADNSLGWGNALSLGTDNAVYVENNKLSSLCPTHVCVAGIIDQERAARTVIRKNIFINGGIQAHGSCSANIWGTFSMEIYNNAFTVESPNSEGRMIALRSGTGVIFNNIYTGDIENTIKTYMDRACDLTEYGCSQSGWTRCNGQPYARVDQTLSDGLQAETNGTGIHNGSNNASILMDSGKSWTSSAFLGMYVYNQADGSYCQIIANNATAVTCTLSGGTENDWDAGDTYKITGGYPCYSQTGTTGSNGITLFPYYIWNNLLNNVEKGMSASGDCLTPPYLMSNIIRENRDYYNYNPSFDGTVGAGSGAGANKPATCTTGVGYWATDEGTWDKSNDSPTTPTYDGQLYRCTATDTWTLAYTPYTYPHPLTLNDDHIPPAAPTGVVVE